MDFQLEVIDNDEEANRKFTPVALPLPVVSAPRRTPSNLLKYFSYAAVFAFAGVVVLLSSSITAPEQKHALRSADASITVGRECKSRNQFLLDVSDS